MLVGILAACLLLSIAALAVLLLAAQPKTTEEVAQKAAEKAIAEALKRVT